MHQEIIDIIHISLLSFYCISLNYGNLLNSKIKKYMSQKKIVIEIFTNSNYSINISICMILIFNGY